MIPRGWQFPGWVKGQPCEAECAKLAELSEGKLVLELGAYCGRSTISMAQFAKMVYTVDWFEGDEGVGKSWFAETFLRNVRHKNLTRKIVALVGDIADVARILPFGFFDMAFIDAAHDTPSVRRDFELVRRCVRRGGVISFHDWNLESVRSAVPISQPEGVVENLSWICNTP